MLRRSWPLGAVCLALAGCGSKVIKPDATAQTLTRFVLRATGFRPTDARCPSGVAAKAGGNFDCHFTGPDGRYVAHMHIVSVHGTTVQYFIRTVRTGG